MIETIEAEEAWWPPTLIPSFFGRRWLALWIIQCDSHSSRRSIVFRCFMFISLADGPPSHGGKKIDRSFPRRLQAARAGTTLALAFRFRRCPKLPQSRL